MSQYKMVNDNMLVRKIEQDRNVTKSGIVVVSDGAESHVAYGRVEAVGPGSWHGEILEPLRVKVGDFIYFNTKPNVQNFGSVPFEPTHGDAYYVCREKDIYAYVPDTSTDDLPF